MTDQPEKLTEKDLERLAKEYGNPLPDHIKQNVLKEIRKTREADLEDHLKSLESGEKDSPDFDPNK